MSLRLCPDLIFDIGMNDGKDTAYYLHRGFKVVAVDANPSLCTAAAQKFPRALTDGRLCIENLAIGANRGQLPFYISSTTTFSSFDRSLATKNGSVCTATEVTCIRAADLFAKHGVPHYLKVDIEGAETHCLADLNENCVPNYLSFESGPETEEDVRRLGSLGYKRFKFIHQAGHVFGSNYEPESVLKKLRRRVRRKSRNLLHGRWYNDWNFEFGSSGPFGEDTDGAWVPAQTLLEIRSRWQELDARYSSASDSFWYDVHAAR